MELAEILRIADSGMTMIFALLVFFELKSMRQEIVNLLHKIDGFIQAKESE